MANLQPIYGFFGAKSVKIWLHRLQNPIKNSGSFSSAIVGAVIVLSLEQYYFMFIQPV
jgi:uncharacterized membrane protein YeaQ/YmgE (transglycosylase-associated protein family)